MASTRRKSNPSNKSNQGQPTNETKPSPTGKIFVGEEDKRLLKKFNKHIVNKLGLNGNRSIVL